MKTKTPLFLLPTLIVSLSSSCDSGESDNTETQMRQGAIFEPALADGTDVTSFQISVAQITCPGEAAPADPYSVEHTIDTAGEVGGGEVLDDPFSDGTVHTFGQLATPLPPGCFEAVASPLKANGEPSDECLPTNPVEFTIQPDQTEEITMISNCPEEGIGAGDIGALQNQTPQMELVAGTTTVGQCGDIEVCFVGYDEDDDALEFEWVAPADVSLAVNNPIDQGDGTWLSCATLNSEIDGQQDITVTVFDLLEDGTRIEDHPSVMGESRATLAFQLHVLEDPDACYDPCEDNPCENGGTCTNDGGGEFTCDCPEGTNGETCETCDAGYFDYGDECAPEPVGGTVSDVGGFRIHTFTSSNSFESFGNLDVEYLLVAGGGGGGSGDGGGGGAGGVLTGNATLPAATYPVVIGAGGLGAGRGELGTPSQNGQDTTFFGLTAIGGGRGGQEHSTSGGGPLNLGGNGGSGGGLGGVNPAPPYPDGGTGTPGQGHDGGSRDEPSRSAGMGGGGGAGGPGGNGTPAHEGGAGGIGISSSISGAATFYGGGGGGSGRGVAGGVGGAGGGGNGGLNTNGTAGAPNTGGGGGGGGDQGTTGGNGGSGIVIVRYPVN